MRRMVQQLETFTWHSPTVGRVTTKLLQETDNNYPVTIQGVISKAWYIQIQDKAFQVYGSTFPVN